jgi:hypothetical protein
MNISKLIYKTLAKQSDEPRNYIGASAIGNPCERAIWYGLNKPESKFIDPKLKLTFEIGKRLESLLLDILSHSFALFNSEFKEKTYPLFKGTIDAIFRINDQDYILEIKSANDSSFNIFKKKGVRLWYPEYYDQIQSYMGMSGIHRCYLLAINKNTSELHDELIIFDEQRYESLVSKAIRIGDSICEPERINNSASFFRCKMCHFRDVCHE